MNETKNDSAKAPWHLWVVGGGTALWNGIASFDFIASVTRFELYLSQFSQELLDYVYGLPTWLFVIWGIAVLGGLIGSILLLLRRRLAVAALAISFVGVIAYTAVGFLRPPPEEFQDPQLTGTIVLIAALLVAYAEWMRRRSVLK